MPKAFFLKPFFFLYRIFFRKLRGFSKSVSSNSHATSLSSSQSKNQKSFGSFHSQRSNLTNQTLIVFDVEGALLKASCLFNYFMLVAFEAGGFVRALVLFLLWPIIFLVGDKLGLKIMVMVCFFGVKKDSFRVGTAVLPKFFLEDVGLEAFEVLQRGAKKIAVSKLPQVMIESFLKDYLEIDMVVGKELKVYGGYFLGIMEEEENRNIVSPLLEELELGGHDSMAFDTIGISASNKFRYHQLFSYCKEVYLVADSDKRSWKNLPRDRYPKKLVFHDGRLALTPTPLETLAILMWAPLGIAVAIFRIIVGISLPYDVSFPLLVFSGLQLTVGAPKLRKQTPPMDKRRGVLYVCNHRTLLDPLYLCFALKKNLHAVTYSLSKMSEILSPIKTVRLTRNRHQDGKMMEKLLNQGDVVVCPEGTTCREPYLLRFSPLFSEISDEIIPIAITTHVSMFHGTTAGGLKCLDPLFFTMNPSPIYTIQLLEKVSGLSTCCDGDRSSFDVANYVQGEIGKALGFESTKLTRRDKYLILAGNEGIASKCTF
ncbi:hypothetical protein ACFX15_046445 [Malus domestica]|uniref:probable glycerol-3-phosphate acyltransferase 3 n=1 Tax=Malus sylvestris TaxID=3752 RepID=UPI0021AC3434|nr:probable glycerol-3-phosphate acyltransferase 3 [Malus sylvestris]